MVALTGFFGTALAQTSSLAMPQLVLERMDQGLWLSTQLDFELPEVVEDALQKGIPIYFVAQADLLSKRWYWADKRLASAQRHLRLSYHPLTQRWRLNISLGESSGTAQGLMLNQNFDALVDAMTSVRRIFRWKIADLDDLESDSKLAVEFRFQLDVAQLPRPLRIGTLGQSDWSVVRSATQALGSIPLP